MTSNAMMNNESNITVDSLTYKELQALAMSLNLPGKMKQGVLVEAIKARQNHNEQAVTMILEANKQRRLMRRQQQQLQQQQNPKLDSDRDLNNKRKMVARARMKRSASEMEMDTLIGDESYKRSKLAAALIQRRPFFTSLTTGATSLTIRKEQQQQQQYQPTVSGCSTWDQHSIIGESAVPHPLPIIPKPLPDLSKDLSILPTLSDCSNSSVATPASSEDLGCCSVGSASSGGSSSWSSMSGGSGNAEQQQPLPQSSYESCDSGWMGTEDSYDLNTWKNLPSNMKMANNSTYDNVAPQSANSSGYFEDNNQSAADMFINNADMYRAEDFIANTSTAAASNYSDYQMPLESSSYQDVAMKPDPWCDSFPSQPQFQQQQNQQSMHAATNEFRIQNECCYDVECYQQGGPYFRIQRPGNPTPVFVPSGRSLTLSTFCNMLPRVASYVQ